MPGNPPRRGGVSQTSGQRRRALTHAQGHAQSPASATYALARCITTNARSALARRGSRPPQSNLRAVLAGFRLCSHSPFRAQASPKDHGDPNGSTLLWLWKFPDAKLASVTASHG